MVAVSLRAGCNLSFIPTPFHPFYKLFFLSTPAFGLLDEIVLQRYMLCLCPARSCPAGSLAKSPHSASLRLYFPAKPCMGVAQHLLGQQNFSQALKAGGANRGKSKTSKTECYGKLRYKPLLRKHGERE